ncbi:hypothetical protein GWI34_30065 [Actinomadura sp. DSM 109109]|nr:hypothetical protein [Actinomadura lepetitiana]
MKAVENAARAAEKMAEAARRKLLDETREREEALRLTLAAASSLPVRVSTGTIQPATPGVSSAWTTWAALGRADSWGVPNGLCIEGDDLNEDPALADFGARAA